MNMPFDSAILLLRINPKEIFIYGDCAVTVNCCYKSKKDGDNLNISQYKSNIYAVHLKLSHICQLDLSESGSNSKIK